MSKRTVRLEREIAAMRAERLKVESETAAFERGRTLATVKQAISDRLLRRGIADPKLRRAAVSEIWEGLGANDLIVRDRFGTERVIPLGEENATEIVKHYLSSADSRWVRSQQKSLSGTNDPTLDDDPEVLKREAGQHLEAACGWPFAHPLAQGVPVEKGDASLTPAERKAIELERASTGLPPLRYDDDAI